MNVYPEPVESEYLNVADVAFVKLAGSDVIDGAPGGPAANANPAHTATPAPKTPSRTSSDNRRYLLAAFVTRLAIRPLLVPLSLSAS